MAGELERELTVHVDQCLCPDGRHGAKGEDVTFRDTLNYTTVRAIRYAAAVVRELDPAASIAEMMAAMNEAFLLHGIEAWTLRDARGRAIDVEPATIRAHVLTNMSVALALGDYADTLYQPQVLHPLAALASPSSPPSPTTESTSAPPSSSSTSRPKTASSGNGSSRSAKRPRPLRPSSTTTTPTADTDRISASSAGG